MAGDNKAISTLNVFKWAIPGLFLFIFVFSTWHNSNLNCEKPRWCAWDSNPGAGWKAQTDPLSYGGPPSTLDFYVDIKMILSFGHAQKCNVIFELNLQFKVFITLKRPNHVVSIKRKFRFTPKGLDNIKYWQWKSMKLLSRMVAVSKCLTIGLSLIGYSSAFPIKKLPAKV